MAYELHLRVYDGTIVTGLYRPQRLIIGVHKPRWALTKLASRPGKRTDVEHSVPGRAWVP